ncbi:hypothetical protein N0V83_009273 [Neocucurbitaria cava]|uniref:Class E vacuolar protein-sorting machinery protein HSE1 n=1 Tax=Neocucurbitaria cava TaxID=798079 RepID=A0A9W8Y281_9PLEO|nr:hypothetical protein N0V83_009273 [Neocucurbitaria cava]
MDRLRQEEANEKRRQEERVRNIKHNARIQAAQEEQKRNDKRGFSFSRLFRSPKPNPKAALVKPHAEEDEKVAEAARKAAEDSKFARLENLLNSQQEARIDRDKAKKKGDEDKLAILEKLPESQGKQLAGYLGSLERRPTPEPGRPAKDYLSQVYPQHTPLSVPTQGQQQGGVYVTALYDYEADEDTGLSFHRGDIIQVISVLESGWWDGVLNGIRGWFPRNFCTSEPGHLSDEDSLSDSSQNTSGDEGSHSGKGATGVSVMNKDGTVTYQPLLDGMTVAHGVLAWRPNQWTKVLDESKFLPERDPRTYGWEMEHRMFGGEDEEPGVVCNVLGHGSLGIVDEVRRRDTTLPTFVRKRVQLPARKAQAKAILNIIQGECENLKSLVHQHIVTLLGTYEEMRHKNRHLYFLLMSPVGDNDLKNFLDIAGEHLEQDRTEPRVDLWRSWIYNWFTCLASALAYMHGKGIRHQDIKPSNIIHKGERIYFTDFSLSCAFDLGNTTSTDNPSRSSPMYAAPEIVDKYNGEIKRHGRASDIFALGCVFCDMLTILTGRSVSSFHEMLASDKNTANEDTSQIRGPLYYSRKLSSIHTWFASSHIFAEHISEMLGSERTSRPSAFAVVQGLVRDHIFDDDCMCWIDALWYKNKEGVLVRRNHGTIPLLFGDGTTEVMDCPDWEMDTIEQHGIKITPWNERKL